MTGPLTTNEAVRWLTKRGYQVNANDFIKWRMRGGGPQWTTVGTRHMFTVEALKAWIAKQQAANKSSKPSRRQSKPYGVHTYERVGKWKRIRKSLVAEFDDLTEARSFVGEDFNRVLVYSPKGINQEISNA